MAIQRDAQTMNRPPCDDNLATSSRDIVDRQLGAFPPALRKQLQDMVRDPHRTVAELERDFDLMVNALHAAHKEIKTQVRR